ncbi:nucleolar and spindle-associated protein 1 [Latimeria chalumnae]|uniref:nucleolar and spindle-associated protein 1 n=1 Tax=Latimeria chalumnae TaxID=7897 RepID=UPI00313A8230
MMEVDLESLKYLELRKLAKSVGLKANLKADKLLKALKSHFQDKQKGEGQEQDAETAEVGSTSQVDTDASNSSLKQQALAALPFVTKRRGRGRRFSKSQSSAEREENDNQLVKEAPPTAEETMLKVPNAETCKENCKPQSSDSGKKQRKRRLTEDLPTGQLDVEQTGKVIVEKEGTQDQESESQGNERALQTGDKETTGQLQKAVCSGGKIPRYTRLNQSGKTGIKPTTPNFKKLHEAHFKKMESIDLYIKRKQNRIEAFNNSVKEVKVLAENANLLKPIQKTEGSNTTKLGSAAMTMFSPPSQRGRRFTVCTPGNLRQSPRISMSANKNILRETDKFKPTVLSTTKMNVRFSEATRDNEHKCSLFKTPARMSPYADLPNTPGTEESKLKKTEEKSAKKCPTSITPLALPNSETPGRKKNAFDLKASLARPLGYQPHKGKLKPWGDSTENATALNKSLGASYDSLKKNYKQPRLQTREERRQKHNEYRQQKKENAIAAKRGLAMN